MSPDEQAPYAAALSGLPGMGPATLVAILDQQAPSEAWDAVMAGHLERPRGALGGSGADRALSRRMRPRSGPIPWRDAARAVDPPAWWGPFAGRGVEVTWWGDVRYPAVLGGDPHPPGVLFWRGRIAALERPCVALVGTRSATPDGRQIAYELGRDLTDAGVCVVSGLALGIDGAAHAGALRAVASGAVAGPVGVAASGVDVPYPTRHARLWEAVVAAGAVISETLPGRPARAWRFPSRNRVIAGLARMVVVVESHESGGSLITADAAIERGVEVRVVPGPVRSPASAGSNQLLYDGPGPVRDAADVLDALGLSRRVPTASAPSAGATGKAAATVTGEQLTALNEIGWRAVTAGVLMGRTGFDAATTLRVLDELRGLHLVREEAGWWSRRR